MSIVDTARARCAAECRFRSIPELGVALSLEGPLYQGTQRAVWIVLAYSVVWWTCMPGMMV